jgi:hypothetical protein
VGIAREDDKTVSITVQSCKVINDDLHSRYMGVNIWERLRLKATESTVAPSAVCTLIQGNTLVKQRASLQLSERVVGNSVGRLQSAPLQAAMAPRLPVPLREIVYSLSPYQQSVITQTFKHAPSSISHLIAEVRVTGR